MKISRQLMQKCVTTFILCSPWHAKFTIFELKSNLFLKLIEWKSLLSSRDSLHRSTAHINFSNDTLSIYRKFKYRKEATHTNSFLSKTNNSKLVGIIVNGDFTSSLSSSSTAESTTLPSTVRLASFTSKLSGAFH